MTDSEPLSEEPKPTEPCSRCGTTLKAKNGKCLQCRRDAQAKHLNSAANRRKLYQKQKEYRERKKKRILALQQKKRNMTQDLFMYDARKFFQRFSACWEKRGTSGYFLPAAALPELQELRQIARDLRKYEKSTISKEAIRKRLESLN